MVSGFILAFSLVALIRFGILYCRGIMLRTAELPVSEEVRAAASLSGEEITGRDFAALAGVHSLTPGGSGGVTLVKAYYRAVQLVGAVDPVSWMLEKARPCHGCVRLVPCPGWPCTGSV